MSTPFRPRQALQFNGALLRELQGEVSEIIARDLVNDTLPTLAAGSVIHDNGCGYGAITMAIMASNPPPGIEIHATDINPIFLGELQATLGANPSWPVKVDQMDACSLSFPNEMFDLSVTDFVFAGLPDGVAAASQILRTLKPGGMAIISVWNEMRWHTALENAYWKTRGDDEPMAPYLSTSGYKREMLQQAINDASWGNVEFTQKTAWLNLGTDLQRWATLAWSFLATPVGGWQQRDENKWEEAIDYIVGNLQKDAFHMVEDGVHKIRMIADVAIMRK